METTQSFSEWKNWWSYLCINLLNCKNHKVMFGRHNNVLWWHNYHVWTLMNFWRFHDFFIYQSHNCLHVLFEIIALLFRSILMEVSMHFKEFENFIKLVSGLKYFILKVNYMPACFVKQFKGSRDIGFKKPNKCTWMRTRKQQKSWKPELKNVSIR